MTRQAWRIMPWLLLTFLLFLAVGTAQEALHDQDKQQPISDHDAPADSPTWEETANDKQEEYVVPESVQEALDILVRIKTPKSSKLAKYTGQPKGLIGHSLYYAKETFMFLFMNQPNEQSSFITTSTSEQPTKLPYPLSKAVELLENAANKEDSADALFLLAEMNFHGNFTHPINYDEAFRKYQQLADKTGNSTAQYMLGFLYATGLSPSVPADQAKSMLYHRFAAEQGNTRSEMTLGYRYHAGIATPQHCENSIEWYRIVADKAIIHYRSGPPGGHSLGHDVYRIADDIGGVYGEGASVSSSGLRAKQGGPTSDAYADMDDVLEYLHLQASKGDIRPMYTLAHLHYDGARGLKKDYKVAKQYFKTVAREKWGADGKTKKNVPALIEKYASKSAGYLGRMFLRGEGMEQSYTKARTWFNRGLKNGDALCQYSLGLMYLKGLGVDKDTVKAADFFAAAADQGLAVAQTNMGMLFLDQGDPKTAMSYFQLAIRHGHIEAYFYLAEMYHQGIGGDASCQLAATNYKLVAEKAEAVWGSLGEANEAYDNGDIDKAIMGFLMAAEQGSEAAQANVAWLLDQTKPRWSIITWLTGISEGAKAVARDAQLALTYWTRSANQANVDSLVKMGDYYLDGLGAPESAEHAAACYQAASELPQETSQSAQAMFNLGWMHENGVGIDQDFHLAKRFYDLALETNKEAYLPVKLSLFKLQWRSWWNDITHGDVNSIGHEEKRKKRTFYEWLNDFLEADAAMYATEHYEEDDWSADHDHAMPGGDDYWDGEDYDDGLIETLVIMGLVAALGYLIYYRQRQQQAAERRRREGVEGDANAAAPPPVQGQQPDGGFFPQPGDPEFGAWAAGGVGH